MNQSLSLLQWRTKPYPYPYPYPVPLPFPLSSLPKPTLLPIASLSSSSSSSSPSPSSPLSPRDLRKLKNEKRLTHPSKNWREKVEEKLLSIPKKKPISWKEKVNLNMLLELGPQWWILRIRKTGTTDLPERLAKSLSIRFPWLNFKVYLPAVDVKVKLKNGTYDVKSKPIYPGHMFIRCILNKEIHDFIREYDKVGCFVGSKVGIKKKMINRPKPISLAEMEKVFQRAKYEQEKADQAFEEELKGLSEPQKSSPDASPSISSVVEAAEEPKPKGRPKRTSNKSVGKLKLGAAVTVVSGAFANFSGVIKKLDAKNGKVAVGFTLFGKETIADLDINEIVAEPK